MEQETQIDYVQIRDTTQVSNSSEQLPVPLSSLVCKTRDAAPLLWSKRREDLLLYDEDLERDDKPVQKWEWFNSDKLLLVLEHLRTIIEPTEHTLEREPPLLNSPEQATNEFWKLRHYGLSADFNSNRCQITYRCSDKFNGAAIGRVYGYSTSRHQKYTTQQICLQTLPRWIRSALASQFYWDVDIVNAHQVLLAGLLNEARIKFTSQDQRIMVPSTPFLDILIEERVEALRELASLSPLHNDREDLRSATKSVFTSLFYGSSMNILWECLQIPMERGEELYLLNKRFGLRAFSQEMKTIKEWVWDFSDLLDTIYPYLTTLKNHPHLLISRDNLFQKQTSFLSLFLQTEERRLLSLIERYFHIEDRQMDSYIHDGGLIRKQVKLKNGIGNPWQNFEPDQAFCIEDISDYFWEESFPIQILRSVETQLSMESPVKYNLIRLAIKPFDDQWKTKFKQRIPAPICFRKTYQELKYFYENHHFLRQIQHTAKYLYDGQTYLKTDMVTLLRENKYFSDIISVRGRSSMVNTTNVGAGGRLSRSTSPTLRSPNMKSEDNDLICITNLSESYSNFWATWCGDEKRKTIEKILFCSAEKDLPQAKSPEVSQMTDPNIARRYVILYKDFRSFDILRGEVGCQTLSMAFEDYIEPPEGIQEGCDFITFLKDTFPLDARRTTTSLLTGSGFRQASYFLNHLHILCGKKLAEFVYLVKYLSRIVQEPTVMEEGCGLILYSEEEGTGKSVAASMMLNLLSPFGKETQNASEIFAQFGVLQENCFLLHIEDTQASEMKQFSSYFKNRITAKSHIVEKKFENKQIKMNLARYIVTTNDLSNLPISENDRRWALIPCSDLLLGKREYFSDLNDKWGSSSVRRSTFLFLHSIQITGFSCERDRPSNSILKDLKSLKLSTLKIFLMGASFWISKQVRVNSSFGFRFFETYKKKVILKDDINNREPKILDAFKKAIWMNSQDLYGLFKHWQKEDSKSLKDHHPSDFSSSLSCFSRAVRKISFECPAVNDTTGRASLPICADYWVTEAQKFNMNEIEDIIPLDSLRIESKKNDSQKKLFGFAEAHAPVKKASLIRRFMMGVSSWLNDNCRDKFTTSGVDFSRKYQRKVNLKNLNADKSQLKSAFWISSLDLFHFFRFWAISIDEENHLYKSQTFSMEVRRLLFTTAAQNDTHGTACLPICFLEWINEMDFNSEIDIIRLDLLPGPEDPLIDNLNEDLERTSNLNLKFLGGKTPAQEVPFEKIFIQDESESKGDCSFGYGQAENDDRSSVRPKSPTFASQTNFATSGTNSNALRQSKSKVKK